MKILKYQLGSPIYDYSYNNTQLPEIPNLNVNFNNQMVNSVYKTANQFNQGVTDFQNNTKKFKSNSVIGSGNDEPSKFNKFINSKGFNIGLEAADKIFSTLPKREAINSNDETANKYRQMSIDFVKSKSKILGTALEGINALGGYTQASQGLGKGTDRMNMIASTLVPGAGWIAGKTDKYTMNEDLKNNQDAFGSSYELGQLAAKNQNAKLLFGKKRANDNTQRANGQQQIVSNIMNNQQLLTDASNNNNAFIRNQNRQINSINATIGKNGLKLDFIDAKRILKKLQNKPSANLEIFKEGGKMNVIPEGALHKNKHNLDKVDEKFEEVTNKGIPVITENDKGEITQHAEVEKEEIIFTLEVTKKLEELMQKNTDESAIEAGKLLVQEILHNTIDNVGLLKTIE